MTVTAVRGDFHYEISHEPVDERDPGWPNSGTDVRVHVYE